MAHVHKNNFEGLLEKHHLKKTGPRLKVLSMLSSKNVATSQPDLESVMDDIDRVTLYRILNAFEEKGIRRRPILPQICGWGSKWPTSGKLGRQFQEEPKSGSLLRSPCTADQVGEPQPVAIRPEHHRQCPRHGCVPVSQAEALDHDLFGVRGPSICDGGANQRRAEVA